MIRSVANRSARPRVAIIGAGIIGLSVGWRLAASGCPVRIFERGEAARCEPGRAASWAAAGMLAAGVEAEPSEETMLPLSLRARALWPGFARELEAASGVKVGYRAEGTLVIALNRDDAEQLRFTYDLQRRLGLEPVWLPAGEALALEPRLNPRLAAASFSPMDHQVDNRLVMAALIEAFRRQGGVLDERCGVAGVETRGGAAVGVLAGGTRHEADVVILAAGALVREVPGLPAEALPPVRPVKGQMLALRMPAAAPLLRHVVWAPRSYLVPRTDGRLIVGATVEERGFDPALTAGGVLALLEGAWRALPAVEECPIEEMWTGFRPGSPDDAPILGPSGVPGLVHASGHHRHGILLAPVTAEAIAAYILSGVVPDTIRAFGPGRFRVEERR